MMKMQAKQSKGIGPSKEVVKEFLKSKKSLLSKKKKNGK